MDLSFSEEQEALAATAREFARKEIIPKAGHWDENGGVASWYSVLATFDPAMKHKGIACFVVDANTPGVKPGRKENKMGQRASNTTDVIFEDVKVHKSQLLGSEDAGFKIAMKTFDRSRPWI